MDTIVIHVRPRPDDAHVTGKYIQELRQLIQIGMTKETAHPRNAGIPFGSLSGIGFRILVHGPEL
jgi:hypothetical protein